jgi:alanyl-tRNA synthetase
LYPLELLKELAQTHGCTIDEAGFEKAFEKHREISKAGADKKFKGGLADVSEITIKYHTATHLLQASLRKVLGDHVFQKGSNITAERLRFDFTHADKMTDEQKQQVEDMVNEQIQKALPVSFEDMTVSEAKAKGALGVFEDRYGEKVHVYQIGDTTTGIFSMEICGGPHVQNTRELNHFKIQKEEASSAGVRRIKAVLE